MSATAKRTWARPRLGLTLLRGLAATAAPTRNLSVDAKAVHANMPFTLTLSAKGFEEQPVPATPELVIDGCTVSFLGVSPSVSSQVHINQGEPGRPESVEKDW